MEMPPPPTAAPLGNACSRLTGGVGSSDSGLHVPEWSEYSIRYLGDLGDSHWSLGLGPLGSCVF